MFTMILLILFALVNGNPGNGNFDCSEGVYLNLAKSNPSNYPERVERTGWKPEDSCAMSNDQCDCDDPSHDFENQGRF